MEDGQLIAAAVQPLRAADSAPGAGAVQGQAQHGAAGLEPSVPGMLHLASQPTQEGPLAHYPDFRCARMRVHLQMRVGCSCTEHHGCGQGGAGRLLLYLPAQVAAGGQL